VDRRARAGRAFQDACLKGRGATEVLTGRMHWTDRVTLLADPPDKAYGRESEKWMSTAIATLLASSTRDVRLITPYFVPGREGLAGLADLARRGVQVSLLTNALSATDKLIVYGAYRHYRGPLLAAGARIAEFSRPARHGRRREVLHSKVFVIDGRQVIVGSPNFDLRSAYTNTELGLVVEEPGLVAEFAVMFAALSAPDQAYGVTLVKGRLRWQVARPGLPAELAVEPEASWRRRAVSWVFGRLPIQTYL
jgi:putative cardiolipin synthase